MTLPCTTSPDDWFIEKDGRQYPDDPKEPEAIKAALRRRRHAKDACYFDCPARLLCLELGMQPDNLAWGTMGGYYPEERRAIAKARGARSL